MLSIRLIALLLFPVALHGQSVNLTLSDSLRFDSLAKHLILTGEFNFNRLSSYETDMVLKTRDFLMHHADDVLSDKYRNQLNDLDRQRQQLRDSVILSFGQVEKKSSKLVLGEVLIRIGDSVSIQFLSAHFHAVFNTNAWHSDTWAQYPLAALMFENSRFKTSWFLPLSANMKEIRLDFENRYFYSEILNRMFIDEEEILLIKLDNLLQQNLENEILEANICYIKSYIKKLYERF